MVIETKYGINDLVKHKFQHDPDGTVISHEVIYIEPVTCSAGTQVFYCTRPIILRKAKDSLDDLREAVRNVGTGKDWKRRDGGDTEEVEKEEKWEIHPTNAKSTTGYDKFREDEIVALPEPYLGILMAALKPESGGE